VCVRQYDNTDVESIRAIPIREYSIRTLNCIAACICIE
jgi:hypothetical protein